MTNAWVEFVKDFARKNNTTYGCALSNPKCSEEYRIVHPKKLTKKKQKEMEEQRAKQAKQAMNEKKIKIEKLRRNLNVEPLTEAEPIAEPSKNITIKKREIPVKKKSPFTSPFMRTKQTSSSSSPSPSPSPPPPSQSSSSTRQKRQKDSFTEEYERRAKQAKEKAFNTPPPTHYVRGSGEMIISYPHLREGGHSVMLDADIFKIAGLLDYIKKNYNDDAVIYKETLDEYKYMVKYYTLEQIKSYFNYLRNNQDTWMEMNKKTNKDEINYINKFWDRAGEYINHDKDLIKTLSKDLNEEFKKKKIGYYKNLRKRDYFKEWVSLR